MDEGPEWKAPAREQVKINVDASVGNEFAAIGLVARNFEGTMIRVQVFKGRKCNVEVAEAIALCKAISMAASRGWKKLILEGDSKKVIESWMQKNDNLSWGVEASFNSVRKICSFFDSFEVTWTPRSINLVADQICKWGVNCLSTHLPAPSGNLFCDQGWDLMYNWFDN